MVNLKEVEQKKTESRKEEPARMRFYWRYSGRNCLQNNTEIKGSYSSYASDKVHSFDEVVLHGG
jgi:hypothetical protein